MKIKNLLIISLLTPFLFEISLTAIGSKYDNKVTFTHRNNISNKQYEEYKIYRHSKIFEAIANDPQVQALASQLGWNSTSPQQITQFLKFCYGIGKRKVKIRYMNLKDPNHLERKNHNTPFKTVI